MARWLCVMVFAFAVAAGAQNSSPPSTAPSSSPSSSSASLPDNPQPQNPQPANPQPANAPPANTKPQNSKESSSPPAQPKFDPPSSSHVDAGALPEGESSSKDDDVDLTPPAGDAKAHPNSPSSFGASEATPGTAPAADVNEMHPWNPHKAAKDVEIGDYYFKQKNYRAAESRYREALLYKDSDAVATYRLAVSLEKLDRFDEAREEYESYLRILPSGPEAGRARKALERLKGEAAKVNPAK